MKTLVYTAEEFLAAFPSPPGTLADHPLPADAAAMVVTVEDEEGTLLGYWPIWQAVHLDGVWLAPAVRREGGAPAIRSLLAAVSATLHANGTTRAFALLTPDTPGFDQATRLGFTRAPGDLYLLQV